jgi:prophage maintenance system killer protein
LFDTEHPNQLTIGDLLLIGERELGQPAEALKELISLPNAASALAAPFSNSSDPVEQAAICCSRLLRASLFPDANKRIAFECMCEMLARSGCPWPWAPHEGEAIAAMVTRLQDRTISEAEFVDWVRLRVAVA